MASLVSTDVVKGPGVNKRGSPDVNVIDLNSLVRPDQNDQVVAYVLFQRVFKNIDAFVKSLIQIGYIGLIDIATLVFLLGFLWSKGRVRV